MMCYLLHAIKIIENSTVLQERENNNKSQRLRIGCWFNTTIAVAFGQIIHISFVQYNFVPWQNGNKMFYIHAQRSHLSFNVCSLDFKLLFQLTSSEKSQLFGDCVLQRSIRKSSTKCTYSVQYSTVQCRMTSQLRLFKATTQYLSEYLYFA